MSEKFGQNPNNNTEQGSSPKEVTWDGVVAAGEALEDEAEATAEQNSDKPKVVKVNYKGEAIGETKQYPTMDSQKKTRDERIADGQEKVAALRNKAKEGLGRVWKGLKDSFYIGVSRGSELPGQIAEGAGRAKEQIGNTLSEARNKAAELFAGGREFILQKASEARTRKEERQKARQERKEARAKAKERRELDRQKYNEAREQDKADNEANKATIDSNKETVKNSKQEQKEAAAKLEEAEKRRREAEEKAKKAAAEYDAAKKAFEADQTNEKLRLEADKKHHLAEAAAAELKIAEFNVSEQKSKIDSAEEEIDKAKSEIDKAKEAMKERAAKARERKNARRQARREALGDKWESAKDKLARVAGKGANWMMNLGRRAVAGAGRVVGRAARAVANKLDPVEANS
jgi:singapore isolate B (sub-type 7) whole genome shotgun sequence assembly, scaffold_5